MEHRETTNPGPADQFQPAASHHQIGPVIGIMSAKGGVGKSFCAGTLAAEIARAGFQVGILDADLTGPSISMLFGVQGPVKTGQTSFLPLQTRGGIKIISPNLLVEDGTQPFIWKNALADKVIEELYKGVEWGELDFLIIDLPPATSEVTVAVLQSIPFAGVVIVSQPQEISTKIAEKAARLAQKMNVDIIGVVENASHYLDPISNEKQSLFGVSHIDSLSTIANAPILARLPYATEFSDLCDQGKIEEIFMPEGQELFEATITSLAKIKAEKSAQPKETVQPSTVTPPEATAVEEMDISSQLVTHTGEPFSDIVIRLIQNQENIGRFEHPEAEGYFLGSCGDRMQIHLQIVHDRILSARFLADGCGATQACGSMITKMACSKTIKEAEKITAEELISALDGLPDDHLHCADLAVMTLREALIDAVEGHGNKKE